MKYLRLFRVLFCCLVFSGLYSGGNAQGTLQFNEVKFIEVEVFVPAGVTPSSVVGDTTITIPANRVWKIESISSGQVRSTVSFPIGSNDVFEFFINEKQYLGNQISHPVKFPVWLPAGTYSFKYFWSSQSSQASDNWTKFSISLIEFNVVP